MRTDNTPPWRNAIIGIVPTFTALLLTACATPVPVVVPAAPPVVSLQKAQAALRTLNFDQREDGYHLSLPAPLIFPFDSTDLSPAAHANLLEIGRELQQLGIDQVMVYGYTDKLGAAAYNRDLSRRRADIVARVITEGGYPASRVVVKGLGASTPIADNSTSLGRSQNRRVVIIVQLPPPE